MQTKKIIFLFFALLSFSIIYAENKVPSVVKEVTIYRQGAKLHNVAEVRLQSGENRIVFEKLSLGCNPQSIQVRIKGNATLMTAAFRTNSNEIKKADQTKAQRLQDSIDLVNDLLEKLKTEQNILQKEEKVIEQNQARVGSGQGTSTNPISINDLKELVNYYRTRINDIHNRIFDINKEVKKLNKQLTSLNDKYYKALQNEIETSGEIVMQINSPLAQTLEITCIYLVNSASWEPLYDLRAESVDKPLNLTYKASIKQSSGLDWKNVKIHLSSAMPLTNNSRPILNPKYIDYQIVAQKYYYNDKLKINEYQLYNQASNVYQAPNAKKEEKEVTAPPPPPIETVDFEEENTQSFNEVFDIEPLHTVLNESQELQIIEYKKEEVPAIFEYHAVPKLEPSVFLLAKVIDYGKYNLLSGNANIFYKDTYIGQSFIDTKTTQDTLLLSLGRDEDIVIKRIKPTDVTTPPRFLNNYKKETIVFDIVIKNNKSIPIKIEVLDQIPLSKNAEIEVELKEDSKAEYNSDYGRLLWRLEIEPRKNKTIRFAYTVKYPKDRVVNLQ